MTIGHVSTRAARAALQAIGTPVAEIPVFLCPRFASSLIAQGSFPHSWTLTIRGQKRYLHQTPRVHGALSLPVPAPSVARLPLQCPGCGAFAQNVEENEAGFYTLTRRTVRKYLQGDQDTKPSTEDELVKAALQNVDERTVKALRLAEADFPASPQMHSDSRLPICDRCHNLQHHETGVPIIHPSIESIEETIFESPHKYNHIYHVIDAADFPMSILPSIHKLLNLAPQRSLNRRSKSGSFHQGKKMEVSFIITRSDLLAPLKSQVDGMMPYLVNVLRDALGRTATNVRLGNVRCVSAIRGWWTKELREEIWERGGGGWMVGKVNVGKSQLFRDVFPKGRRGHGVNLPATSVIQDQLQPPSIDGHTTQPASVIQADPEPLDLDLDPESLLPPPCPPTDYPYMPLVSSLPGTTASPLRIPFGSSGGELIDLPGTARSSLEIHVKPIHRPSLVMKSRIRPEQQVIKPGQSLLLGGFIRITPMTPDLIFLAYAFTPFETHLTSAEKAIGIQEQTSPSQVTNIAIEGTGKTIRSAGRFAMRWDVTKERTGPLMRKDAVALRAEQLPYKVMGMDILIEGVGWVEVVAQVRKTREERRRDEKMLVERKVPRWEKGEDWVGSKPNCDTKDQNCEPDDMVHEKSKDEIIPFSPTSIIDSPSHNQGEGMEPSPYPEIEVFTPEGKFIASRRPMNAWLHIASKPDATKGRGRPRKSMKGRKKLEKAARLTGESRSLR